MPITSSAKKALRVSKRKHVYNVRTRDAIVDITKKIKKLVSEKKPKEAMKLLPEAYAIIDKAAKTDFIKQNTSNRKKSRLSAMIKKVA